MSDGAERRIKHLKPEQPVPPDTTKGRSLSAMVLLILVAVAGFMIYRKVPTPPLGMEVDDKRAASGDPLPATAGTSPAVNTKPFESLGSFAADEVFQFIGDSGSIAIVRESTDPKLQYPGRTVNRFKAVAAEVESFKEHLKRKGQFTFHTEHKLVQPTDPPSWKTVWPAGEFTRLLEPQTEGVTIVCFCYLPGRISESEKGMLRTRTGKLIVVAGALPEVQPYIDERLAHLVVTSKLPVPPATSSAPETPDQWVRRVHTVLKQ